MTATNKDELLFWHHIENEDFDGASQHAESPAVQLRRSANKYLDDAVASGEVTRSSVFIDERLGKFVGYTTVETVSGVKIMKTSDGSLSVTTDYEERKPGSNPGDYQDLEVEIELPMEGEATVREDRAKVVDHERTGDGGSRTLRKAGRERVMGEVTKLIWQTFE